MLGHPPRVVGQVEGIDPLAVAGGGEFAHQVEGVVERRGDGPFRADLLADEPLRPRRLEERGERHRPLGGGREVEQPGRALPRLVGFSPRLLLFLGEQFVGMDLDRLGLGLGLFNQAKLGISEIFLLQCALLGS